MLEPTDQLFFNFVSSPLCTLISSLLSSLCSHLRTHPNSHPVKNYFNLSLLSSLCSHLRTHPPHNSHPISINSSLLYTLISELTHLITLTRLALILIFLSSLLCTLLSSRPKPKYTKQITQSEHTHLNNSHPPHPSRIQLN